MLQPAPRGDRVHRDALLEPARPVDRAAHGPAPGRLDAGLEPLPRRDGRPPGRSGGDDERAGSGGRLAIPSNQPAVCREGLLAGDLLLDHRRDERVDHEMRGRDPVAAEPAVGSGDDVVVRGEPAGVVPGPEQRGDRIERPARAGTPGAGDDLVRTGCQGQGRGAFRAAEGPPPGAIAVGGARRVAGAAPERAEDRADRHGTTRPPLTHPLGLHDGPVSPTPATACRSRPQRHATFATHPGS